MNLKQALYLQTIAREGSITNAAKKLYVSQPSLSQMLRQLEGEAGLPLFDRSFTPLRPTYAGERYLHAAQMMLNAQESLESELRAIRKEDSGRMRVGVSTQRMVQLFPTLLPLFQERYPAVVLELHEAGSALQEQLVREGAVDLALASTEATASDLVYDLLEAETFGVLCGPGSTLAAQVPDGTPISLKEAAGESFLILKEGHNARVILDTLRKRERLRLKVALESDSMEAVRQIAAAGPYCTLCSDLYADQHLREGGARFFPLKDYENRRHFYACYRQGQYLPGYVRDFIELTRACCHGLAGS